MILYLILSLFSSSAFASESCRDAFEGSKRSFQVQANHHFTHKELWPRFRSVAEEKRLERNWNRSVERPDIFDNILPKGASIIGHRLRESQAPYLVKIPAQGANLILKVSYESQNKTLNTNVTINQVGSFCRRS